MTAGRTLLLLVVLVVLAISAFALADDSPIVTFALGDYPFFNQGTLTDKGTLVYSAGTCNRGGIKIYVNHVSISDVSVVGSEVYGLSDNVIGDFAFWWARPSCADTSPGRAFMSSIGSLTTSELTVFPLDVTASRVIKTSLAGTAWYGTRKSTGTSQDVYRDGTVLSDILGNQRTAYARDISPNGSVAWDGFGSATGGAWDAYLDKVNYSKGLLTGSRRGQCVAVNSRGTLLWTGQGDNTLQNSHVFVGSADYSTGIVGPTFAARGFYINDSNSVLWVQYGPTPASLDDLWLNGTNLSAAALPGDGRQAVPFGLSATGDALWTGSSDATRKETPQDVFLNAINVSRAVLGANRGTGQALAINNLGWAAWYLPTSPSTSQAYVTMVRTSNVRFQLALPGWIGTNPPSAVVSIAPSGSGWGRVDIPLNAAQSTSVMLPRGLFDITFKVNYYLHKTITQIDSKDTSIHVVTLSGGDTNFDNKVDLQDLSGVLGGMGTPSPDLNGDGVVDFRDLSLVLANLSRTGDP